MPKIKLTKGELKKQRDALKQYNRYLPTLQLKKQQLQTEILRAVTSLEEKKHQHRERMHRDEVWAGLLSDACVVIKPWIKPMNVVTSAKNIAGVDIPVFNAIEFSQSEYDLFLTPLWVDAAIEALRATVSLREEIKVVEESVELLKQELRITTQRVNLFEKVKIPEAEETIRVIKIYIGDQMTNAVGRSKMAKKKIEEFVAGEVAL